MRWRVDSGISKSKRLLKLWHFKYVKVIGHEGRDYYSRQDFGDTLKMDMNI